MITKILLSLLLFLLSWYFFTVAGTLGVIIAIIAFVVGILNLVENPPKPL